MGSTEDTWKKFCAKSLYEQLTENLFIEACDDAQGKDNVFYYLEDKKNSNLLDKCFCAVSSYKEYKIYKDASFIIRKNGNDGYNDFTVFAGRSAKFRLENEDIKLSGEVLNNSTYILTKYKTDIGDNGDKKKFSELSKMFFHLVTTVGNIMPWPIGFNPRTGGRLDIFQYKFSDSGKSNYWNLHDKDKQKENSKWVEIVIDKGNIDKRQYKEIELWKKSLVNVHYLQDFVNENETEALIFYDETITDSNIRWNLYFYRASKAIMKRSYRILTKEDPNKDGKSKFDIEFSKFCKKYEVEEDVNNLTKYFNNKIKEIKNELEEMKALIEQL
ncbi:MAG: hypothetical protein ACTTG8_08545 [Catonella sp.]|uniref:hypothetical protein n=1 Tax=Catonella sp. TaxID=2382125 RepID=UPI003F9F9BB7